MKNILKEYIRLILEDEQKDFRKTLKIFANEIGGKFSPKDGDRGPHIRFYGTPADLRTQVEGNEVAIISPGKPDAKSGKYPTYIFKSENKDIPVVLIDLTEKNILSSGKMLGYGAEHAVYSALSPDPSPETMYSNIENDSRLRTALRTSPQAFVENFYADCDSMLAAFLNEIESKQLKGLKATDEPPSGGNDLIDVVALLGETKYNIHVKYQSNRLIGLRSEKRSAATTADQFNAVKDLNPSNIYKDVRDAMIKGSSSFDDIYDVFKDEQGRADFYSEMEKKGFSSKIDTLLKTQLGYASPVSDVTLLVKFSDTESVDIETISSGPSKEFNFVVKKPEEAKQKISRAFVVDAVGKEVNIKNVFYLEIGSAARRRGIDVEIGEGYKEFIKTMKKT
jgi:hypothetical protein